MEKIKYFNQQEIQAILSEDLKNKNYNHYLLCLTLAYTGARISEALEIKKKDINKIYDPTLEKDHYYLNLITLKQKKKTVRNIPLHDVLNV